MLAPILQHESRKKDVLEGHAPFYFNLFRKKSLRDWLYSFLLPICVCNRVRSVSFSEVGLRDRDIIFRDKTELVFCFLSCLVKFPALEANSWRRRASSNPSNWVYVFFSFFSPSYRFSTFSRSNAHTLTQTRKVQRHAERPKGDREQFASLDFWITD